MNQVERRRNHQEQALARFTSADAVALYKTLHFLINSDPLVPLAKADLRDYEHVTLPKLKLKYVEPRSFLSSLFGQPDAYQKIAQWASSNVVLHPQNQMNKAWNVENLSDDGDEEPRGSEGFGILNPLPTLQASTIELTVELFCRALSLGLDQERNAAIEENERNYAETSFNAQIAIAESAQNAQNITHYNAHQLAAAHSSNEFTLAQLTLRSQERQHGLDVIKEIVHLALSAELQRDTMYVTYDIEIRRMTEETRRITYKEEKEQQSQQLIAESTLVANHQQLIRELFQQQKEFINKALETVQSIHSSERERSAKEARAALSFEQLKSREESDGVPSLIAGRSEYLKQIKFPTNNSDYASCKGISLYQLFTQEATTLCAEVRNDFKYGLTIHKKKLDALGKLSRESVVESMLDGMPIRKFLFFNFVIDSLNTKDLQLKPDVLLEILLDKFTLFSEIPSKEEIKPVPVLPTTPKMMRYALFATLIIVAAVVLPYFKSSRNI